MLNDIITSITSAHFFNEGLWLSFAVIDLAATILVFRFFGRNGLFALIALDVVLCNIQVLKTVNLFGLTTTLGNVLYGSVFLITNMLGEFYGKKEARKGIVIGFAMLVMAMLYMKIAVLYQPDPSDFIQSHFEAIFNVMPRITLASLAAYTVSQMHDIWAYLMWKKLTKGRHLWLRNNASTLVSQFIDTLVFCSIAFIGMFETKVIIEIFISTYIIKSIVSVLDTPFLYVSRRIYHTYVKKDEKIEKEGTI